MVAPQWVKDGLARLVGGSGEHVIESPINYSTDLLLTQIGNQVDTIGRSPRRLQIVHAGALIALCNALLQTNPETRKVYLARAYGHGIEGDHADAFFDLDLYRKSGPLDGPYYNTQSAIFYLSGDYTGAIKSANPLIGRNPDSANGYLLRAIALNALLKFVDAMGDVEEALKLWPMDHFALSVRSGTHIGLGQFDKALHDLEALMRDKPTFAQARVAYDNRAHVMNATGKMNAAIRLSESLIVLDPENLGANVNLGESYRLIQYSHTAQNYYQRVLQFFHNLPEKTRQQEDYINAITAERGLRLLGKRISSYIEDAAIRKGIIPVEITSFKLNA